MITLHQLRCYLATIEHGSFTAAADALDMAQPSVSEQVRLLEKSVDAALFRRAGRGVVATEAAEVLRPYAENALAAVDEAARAVASVRDVVGGTVRFGVFGTARIYLTGDLVADMLAQHPGIRLELVGQNSLDVLEALRRGRLEAAIIALPIDDDGLQISPVMRDEVVYVSADPARLAKPVTAADLATAPLVLSEASWGDTDSTRRQLQRAVQSTGRTLTPRIEVEDIETALEIAALGLADAITARGILHRLGDRLSPNLGWVPLRPRIYDEFAVVHRRGVELSPASSAVVALAVDRMRAIDRAVRARPSRDAS
ncbi:LysR family transcriptional regulator [Jatrophihabitans sp. DSM 45814]